MQPAKPSPWLQSKRPLLGDYWLILMAVLLLAYLFQHYWHTPAATQLQIRQGGKVLATMTLDQTRTIEVAGPMGVSRIQIEPGRARFIASPCQNQYCVHQGWLSHQDEAALCLPNRISIRLLGQQSRYDSLNY